MNFSFDFSALGRRLHLLPPAPGAASPAPGPSTAVITAPLPAQAAPAPPLVTMVPIPDPPAGSVPHAPSGGGLRLSEAYTGLIKRFEGIKGEVPGKPGRWTWYYDSVGVPTLGYGHALHHPVTGVILKKAIHGAATADLANQAMVKYYGSTDISMDQVMALKARDMQNYADDAALHIRTDTIQREFDMLVDFAYNVGEHALETSTLLRLHNAGNVVEGPLDAVTLAANSRSKRAPRTISDAFCVWSNADHVWNLGVFHRRHCEAMIYFGMDYNAAYAKAWAFKG